MKRDMDLVRNILIRAELSDGPLGLDDFMPAARVAVPDKEPEALASMVWYHLGLLDAQDMIDCRLLQSDDGSIRRADVYGLTWDGQDFLDALRDDSVWEKTKRAVRESVGSTTFEVVKRAAVDVATRMALGAVAGMF